MRIILILCLSMFLFANVNQDKAEVKAQNLLEGGYYKEAKLFLEEERVKYPNSEALWIFSATTEYELKNFDSAMLYFKKTLEINPKNEQASDFISKIEAQEEAQENKALSQLFDWLGDKGLDFLLIFLAFLGGEIIAKKYVKCSSREEKNIVKQYALNKQLLSSFTSRLKFTITHFFDIKKMFCFCGFLNVIMVVCISGALLIVWLVIELVGNFNFFISSQLNFMNPSELWMYAINAFGIFTFFTISLQFIMYLIYVSSSSKDVKLDMIEYIEKISENNHLNKLDKFVTELKKHNISLDDTIFQHLSSDAKEKILLVNSLESKK